MGPVQSSELYLVNLDTKGEDHFLNIFATDSGSVVKRCLEHETEVDIIKIIASSKRSLFLLVVGLDSTLHYFTDLAW